MEIKFLLGIIAVVFAVGAYVPYFISIARKETKPHIYTWLIWTATSGIAGIITLYGGGGFGALKLFAGATLAFVVFLFSFKYGTKDVTRGDTITLALALLAILVWWQLQNPLLAVLMVSAIDAAGYLPTYRKLWKAPWSEDLRAWVLTTAGYVFALAALTEYNLLTVAYLATLLTANAILLGIIVARREKGNPAPIH